MGAAPPPYASQSEPSSSLSALNSKHNTSISFGAASTSPSNWNPSPETQTLPA